VLVKHLSRFFQGKFRLRGLDFPNVDRDKGAEIAGIDGFFGTKSHFTSILQCFSSPLASTAYTIDIE
jgi:hypothetical protein